MLVGRTRATWNITWQNVGPQNEKGFENENRYTTIAYNYPGRRRRSRNSASPTRTKEETINSKIKWVAFKQQFFSSILIAGDDFQNGSVKFTTFAPYRPRDQNVPYATGRPLLRRRQTITHFSFYFGPNKYSTLNKYDDLHLQKLVPLGGWIIRLGEPLAGDPDVRFPG